MAKRAKSDRQESVEFDLHGACVGRSRECICPTFRYGTASSMMCAPTLTCTSTCVRMTCVDDDYELAMKRVRELLDVDPDVECTKPNSNDIIWGVVAAFLK